MSQVGFNRPKLTWAVQSRFHVIYIYMYVSISVCLWENHTKKTYAKMCGCNYVGQTRACSSVGARFARPITYHYKCTYYINTILHTMLHISHTILHTILHISLYILYCSALDFSLSRSTSSPVVSVITRVTYKE